MLLTKRLLSLSALTRLTRKENGTGGNSSNTTSHWYIPPDFSVKVTVLATFVPSLFSNSTNTDVEAATVSPLSFVCAFILTPTVTRKASTELSTIVRITGTPFFTSVDTPTARSVVSKPGTLLWSSVPGMAKISTPLKLKLPSGF